MARSAGAGATAVAGESPTLGDGGRAAAAKPDPVPGAGRVASGGEGEVVEAAAGRWGGVETKREGV